MSQLSCDIIIPIWNQRERTRRCLTSILTHTRAPYRLLLIDNASEKPTQQFLEQFRRKGLCPVILIRNEENLGNVKAVNQGIRVSNAPYVCALDNDTVVFPGWLEKMIQAAESREEIGIANPGSNSLGYQKPWYLSWTRFAEQVARCEKGRIIEMGTATGFCMLIKRNVIDQIGGWCEDYGMGYYEDRDYSRRAAQAGFLCVHAREAFVYHEEHASFGKEKGRRHTLSFANRTLFESRFGASQRIAYCLNDVSCELKAKVWEEAVGLARGNHWIWVIRSRSSGANGALNHSNLKVITVPRPFFTWACLVFILKKKKRFHKIYSSDRRLISELWRFKRFHGGEPVLLDGTGKHHVFNSIAF